MTAVRVPVVLRTHLCRIVVVHDDIETHADRMRSSTHTRSCGPGRRSRAVAMAVRWAAAVKMGLARWPVAVDQREGTRRVSRISPPTARSPYMITRSSLSPPLSRT
jgi:hypothetical protein